MPPSLHPWSWLQNDIVLHTVDSSANCLRSIPVVSRRTIIDSVLTTLEASQDVNSIITNASQFTWFINSIGAAFDLPFTSQQDQSLVFRTVKLLKQWFLNSPSPKSPFLLYKTPTFATDLLHYTLLAFHPQTGDYGNSQSFLSYQVSAITEISSLYKLLALHLSSSTEPSEGSLLIRDTLLRISLCAIDLSMRLEFPDTVAISPSPGSYAQSICPIVFPLIFDLFLFLKVDDSDADLWLSLYRICLAFTGGPLHSPETTPKDVTSSLATSAVPRGSSLEKGWQVSVGPGCRKLIGNVWSIVVKYLTDRLISSFNQPQSSTITCAYPWSSNHSVTVDSSSFSLSVSMLRYHWLRSIYLLGDLSLISDPSLYNQVFGTVFSIIDKMVSHNQIVLSSENLESKISEMQVFTPNSILELFGSWLFSSVYSSKLNILTNISSKDLGFVTGKSLAMKSLCRIFATSTPGCHLFPTTDVPLFLDSLVTILSCTTEDYVFRQILSYFPSIISAKYLSHCISIIFPFLIIQCLRNLGLTSPPVSPPSNNSIKNDCVKILSSIVGLLSNRPLNNEFGVVSGNQLSMIVSGQSKSVTKTSIERSITNPLWKVAVDNQNVDGQNDSDPITFTLDKTGITTLISQLAVENDTSLDAFSLGQNLLTFNDGIKAIKSFLIFGLSMEKSSSVLISIVAVLSQLLRISCLNIIQSQSESTDFGLSIICSILVLLSKRPESWDTTVYSAIFDFFSGLRSNLIVLLRSKKSREVFANSLLVLAKFAQDPPSLPTPSTLGLPIHVQCLRTLETLISWPEMSSILAFSTDSSLLKSLLHVSCTYAKIEEDDVTTIKKPKTLFNSHNNNNEEPKMIESVASLTRSAALSLVYTLLSVSGTVGGYPASAHLLHLSPSPHGLSLLSSDVSEVDLMNFLAEKQEELEKKGGVVTDLRGLMRFQAVNEDVLLTSLDLSTNSALFLCRSYSHRHCWKLTDCASNQSFSIGKLDLTVNNDISNPKTFKNHFNHVIFPIISNSFEPFKFCSFEELLSSSKSATSNFSLIQSWTRTLIKMSNASSLNFPSSLSLSSCSPPPTPSQSLSNIVATRKFFWLLSLLQPEPAFFSLSPGVKLARHFRHLDGVYERECAKIGVVYVGPGQTDQREILANSRGSTLYNRFLLGLGAPVNLANHTGFLGGLDRYGVAGSFSLYFSCSILEIMFHVQTLMPTNHKDSQQIHKKKHIGNDYVHIVFNESGYKYNPNTISSQFNFVHIIITPLNDENVLINIHSKDNIPQFGPLTDGAIIPLLVAPDLVRETAVNANRLAKNTTAPFRFPFSLRMESIDDVLQKHVVSGVETCAVSSVLSEVSEYHVLS
ncbi:hypothetical protein RCL1_007010 [Eukaryota sp. TZLM3-RCL]